MMRYVVTGGCGFIGSNLCELLASEGHYIRVLDDLSSGVRLQLQAEVEMREADLRDHRAVDAAVAGMDACFHLAAVASISRCNEDWHHSHLANSAGTVAVFAAAARAGIPVVYASSAAVYGDNPDLPLRED